MSEVLSNNSLFVYQLYEDKSLVLGARCLIFFTTDLQTVNCYTARADLFLIYSKPNKIILIKKVSKGAKIRNRYNQVPHLTQDTNGKVTNSQ